MNDCVDDVPLFLSNLPRLLARRRPHRRHVLLLTPIGLENIIRWAVQLTLSRPVFLDDASLPDLSRRKRMQNTRSSPET